MLKCAITIDVDSLHSIFKGKDLKQKERYSYLEYEMGMQNMLKLFDEFGIKATFFVVGQDLTITRNQNILKQVYEQGHEIASHTMHHTQGFRMLDKEKKTEQLVLSEEMIEQTISKKPVGFRSPGWNISDDAVDILIERGYLYDSSLFPTYLMPLLKYLHYVSMSSRSKIERTTMGQMDYMIANPKPYETDNRKLRQKGSSGFYEFPVSVTPIFRIPFFATLLLATGMPLFKFSYKLIRAFHRPIVYLFHLFDFVDFSHPEFMGQLPGSKGVYVPASISTPFSKKYKIFHEALSIIAGDYSFMTLEKMRETL
jgi:peptidoglycan/xylan/chitin deacetylase (PgdA/CDA1 family)